MKVEGRTCSTQISILSIRQPSYSHTIQSTSAMGKGGAIFVLDSDCGDIAAPFKGCFMDYLSFDTGKLLLFESNRASQGSVLYGGLLDRCLPSRYHPVPTLGFGLKAFKHISDYNLTDPLAISITACFCANEFNLDCSLRKLNDTKMPGETLKVMIAVLDQNKNALTAVVKEKYQHSWAKGKEKKRCMPNARS